VPPSLPPPLSAWTDFVFSAAFLADCGEISKLKLLCYKEGTLAGKKNSGRAFVTFKEEAGAKAAEAKSGAEWMEREVSIEVIRPKATKAQLSVFVGALDWGVDDEMLATFFRPCGALVSAKVMQSEEGKSKGFGFVQFEETAAVEEALKLDGKNFQNRAVAVKRSIDKDKKTKAAAVAKPTGKAKVHAESRSFVVTGVSIDDVSSRISQVLQETAGVSYDLKKDGFGLEFNGQVADSKQPAAVAATNHIQAEALAEATVVPETSDAYHFELSVGPNTEDDTDGDATPPVAADPDVFSVTMAFVSGSNLSRKAFWLTFEAMERDVQRTSRKWRRLAAKKGEAVPGPQAVPAPKKKQNIYDQNASNVQSAISMGLKEAMKAKKKKKKDKPATTNATAAPSMDMFE